MKWKEVSSTVKSLEDIDIASVLLDFFVWQYNQANTELIHAEYELKSYYAANKSAEDVYNKEYEPCGWGPKLPYNENAIKYQKSHVEEVSKNVEEAKAFLDFVKRKILEKTNEKIVDFE